MQTPLLILSESQSKLFCIIVQILLLINTTILCPDVEFDLDENNDYFRENIDVIGSIRHEGPHAPIPENFDSRKAWPHCKSIKYIANQGKCGNCWAHATSGMMSDRTCIASNETLQRQYSTEDLFTCCSKCTQNEDKCRGGSTAEAVLFWINEGLVSGGKPGSHKGCKPLDKFSVEKGKFIPCIEECTNKKYKRSYERDKMRGAKLLIMAVNKGNWNNTQLQIEIMTNGPVVGRVRVSNELIHAYRGGVHEHGLKEGEEGTNHAVRIIGWGVENEKPYWLIANSWSERYGEKGCFKILRGNNTLNVEQTALAGVADDSSSAKKPNNLSIGALIINLFLVITLRFVS